MGAEWKLWMRRRIPLLVTAGIAAAALLFTVFRDMGVIDTWRMRKTREQLLDGNARLRAENGRLRTEVDRLKTNPSYIEEIARRDLGLIGQKENVIVLDRKTDDPSARRSGRGEAPGRP